MSRTKQGDCDLCKRDSQLSFHHLIPRTLHSNKWFKKNFTKEEMNSGINLCSDCHSAIHRFISEKELGRNYNTVDKLMEDEKVKGFVEWVAKR